MFGRRPRHGQHLAGAPPADPTAPTGSTAPAPSSVTATMVETTMQGVTLLAKGKRRQQNDVFELALNYEGIEIRHPGLSPRLLSWGRVSEWDIKQRRGGVLLTLRGGGHVTPLVIPHWNVSELGAVMREVTSQVPPLEQHVPPPAKVDVPPVTEESSAPPTLPTAPPTLPTPPPSPPTTPSQALSTRVTAKASRVLTLTVIDQGFSSLSNFALAGIVAHYSHAGELGIYAIITSAYIIGQGLVRSCTSDCMLTRAETDDDVMAPYERGGYISAFMAATVVAGLIALSCLFLHHQFLWPMLVFAICFPFIALQDFSRYIGISRHIPGYAVGLDATWLVLFIAAFIGEKATHHTSLAWLVGAWTATGALVGLWTVRRHLATRGIRTLLRFWFASEGSIGWKFSGQFLLSQAWPYVIFFLLALFLSVGALGVFKLSQLAMGPVSVASVGLQSAMISMAAKKFPYHPMRTLRFIFGVASGTAVVTAAWMFLAYFAPVHAMTSLLGPTWPQARHIVIYAGLGFVIASWSGAGAAGLRALRAAKENLWLAVFMIPFLIVPALVGAKLHGLHGAAIGAVISNVFMCVFTWIVLIWVTRKVKPIPEPPGPAVLDAATATTATA